VNVIIVVLIRVVPVIVVSLIIMNAVIIIIIIEIIIIIVVIIIARNSDALAIRAIRFTNIWVIAKDAPSFENLVAITNRAVISLIVKTLAMVIMVITAITVIMVIMVIMIIMIIITVRCSIMSISITTPVSRSSFTEDADITIIAAVIISRVIEDGIHVNIVVAIVILMLVASSIHAIVVNIGGTLKNMTDIMDTMDITDIITDVGISITIAIS